MSAGGFANAKEFLNDLFKDDGSPNLELLQQKIDLLRDTEETDEDFYYTGSISETLLYIKFKSKENDVNTREFQIWTDDSLIVKVLLDCFGTKMRGVNYYEIFDRDSVLVQTPEMDRFISNTNFNNIEFDIFIFTSFTQILQKLAIKVQEEKDQEQAEQQADFDNYRRDFLNYINS